MSKGSRSRWLRRFGQSEQCYLNPRTRQKGGVEKPGTIFDFPPFSEWVSSSHFPFNASSSFFKIPNLKFWSGHQTPGQIWQNGGKRIQRYSLSIRMKTFPKYRPQLSTTKRVGWSAPIGLWSRQETSQLARSKRRREKGFRPKPGETSHIVQYIPRGITNFPNSFQDRRKRESSLLANLHREREREKRPQKAGLKSFFAQLKRWEIQHTLLSKLRNHWKHPQVEFIPKNGSLTTHHFKAVCKVFFLLLFSFFLPLCLLD